jgi:hypothetical protein
MAAHFSRVRPLLYVLWIVAALRFALDATVKPGVFDPLGFVSVYYFSAVLLLLVGIAKTWDDLSYAKMLGAWALTACLAFGVPNAITDTAAQFAGWQHGRFRPPPADGSEPAPGEAPVRGPRLQESALGKVGVGLAVAGGTTVAGFLWCALLGTLVVYVPARVRRGRAK